MRLPREQRDRWDGLLFVLAFAGFLLYFAALRSQHPDAAASYELGDDGAIAAAEAFLQGQGYARDNLEPRVTFRRTTALLDSLQAHLGRPRAVEVLGGEGGLHLPAHFWHVEYVRAGEDDGEAYWLRLNRAGAVWEFQRETSVRPEANRSALLAVLRGGVGGEQAPTLPDMLSDAALASAFTFAAGDSAWSTTAMQAEGFDGVAVLQRLVESGGRELTLQMGSAWAVALARHHLAQTAVAWYDLRVDSAWVLRADGRSAARVRFSAPERYLEQAVAVEVDVAPSGVLLRLNTLFNEAGRASQPSTDEGGGAGAGTGYHITWRDAAAGVVVLAYVALLVIFLFIFFRRLNAGLIDIATAVRDAFWGGFFLALFIGLMVGPGIVATTPNLGLGLLIISIGALVGGAGGAFAIFFISSAVDSLARDSWPQKLETLSLGRHGSLRNVPLGFALLRGLAVAGVLVGVVTLALLLFPNATLNFTGQQDAFLFETTPLPFGMLLGYYGYVSQFLSLLVLLGAGTLLYRWKPHAAVVVPGLVLLLLIVQVGPFQLHAFTYKWVFSGAVGTVLALAFWRYDVLTCLVGYLFLGLLWETAPGWMVPGLPMERDALLVGVLFGAALGVGLVGLLSRRAGSAVPVYVPRYMQELAQEERLKRELEIAHQVQESFLPRKMPKVEGMEVAAMCLAAQEVGGDYYDFIELGPGRLAVVVGDVSGKGIQAGFFMTLTKGFLLSLCKTVQSPAEVLRRLNTLFCENAPRGIFISMIFGVIDVEARTFTFARAGHNPVILKRSPSQEADLMQPTGMAIGLVSGPRFDQSVEEVSIHLRPGDVLVFYTDGFSEAMNAAREQYTDKRLAQKVSGLGQRSAVEILRAVSEDVHHFVEATGRHDDMTMVVVKLDPRAPQGVSSTVQRQSTAQPEL